MIEQPSLYAAMLISPYEQGRQDALRACYQDRDTYNPPAAFWGEYGRGWQAGCDEYDAAQLAKEE